MYFFMSELEPEEIFSWTKQLDDLFHDTRKKEDLKRGKQKHEHSTS